MIKVLFDHQIFSLQVYGGISRYFANIIKSLQKNEEIEVIQGFLYSKNYYQKAESHGIKRTIFRFLTTNKADIYQKNTKYSKYLIRRNDFDVFHATYFDPYFLNHLRKPLVITIHDMIYERFPHFFSPEDPTPQQKRELAQAAAMIIAISETTKKDIIKYLGIEARKIKVIPHGIDTDTPQYETIDNIPEHYILFVGSRDGYKNFLLLAEAFKKIVETNKKLHLVLAGGVPLTVDESQFLAANQILDKTFHLSATDNQLNTLYKNAICFVFPSLYEGFGIPILEAFKNNCPVLLSNSSCFPEIAGDAALYFDPESISSLISNIQLLMRDDALRNKLRQDGKLKLKSYTLDKCLNATINVYKELTSNNRGR
ncbi:4-alpha-N-acetylgalactosaminyltransferase [compost metagenome]